MVRVGFENELKTLKQEVVDMLDKTEFSIKTAVKSLAEKDVELAKEVIKLDNEIDQIMYEIEEKAIELIALQQPMAKDLRMIFAITKMITNIERVGDFGVNIAKEVIKIGSEEHIKKWADIVRMAEIVISMIDKVKSSLILEDVTLAMEVGEYDDIVDTMYKDIYNDVLIMIHKNSDYISQGTKILFVGRYIERMADHLTNVCEMIIYLVKGERVEIN